MLRSRSGKATFAVAALLLMLFGLENFGAERFGATALLLYLPQHGWGLPPLILLGWSLWRRNWKLTLANGFALLFWAHFLLGFRFGFRFFDPPKSGHGSRTFRVMTYNIERGAGGLSALEAAIRAQNPDIVCLQETQGVNHGLTFAVGEKLAARFPLWSVAKAGDVTTLSRFPLLSQRQYPLRGTRRILETHYRTPRGRLRVLNLHIATSFMGQSADQSASQSYARGGKMGRIAQVLAGSAPSAQARMAQIAPLRIAMRAQDDARTPLLVAGDFNSPPRGLFFGAISRGLDDAWQRGGRGTGSTFPAQFPLLPIDHVLARNLTIARAFVPDVRASDHRPLVVDFRFQGGRSQLKLKRAHALNL